MVNDSSIPPEAILNPYTPLVFLPPEFAENYQIVHYVHVAIFAVSLLITMALQENHSQLVRL
jgi:hypothetical protein